MRTSTVSIVVLLLVASGCQGDGSVLVAIEFPEDASGWFDGNSPIDAASPDGYLPTADTGIPGDTAPA